MKSIRVLYHDNCFDGLASAAVFSSFYRGKIAPGSEIEYEGLTHKAGQRIDENLFGANENVIVDFKYSASEKLTWWFDHHQSAFLSEADEKHFRSDNSGKKFHDATFTSCTKFIAWVAKRTFGFEDASLQELIHWADIIDGAQFPDAKFAVELKEPAMRLMLVIEASHSPELIHRIIREIQTKSLAEVIALPEIGQTFEKLYAHHFESIEIMRRAAKCENGVIEFDVSNHDLDGYNKFIPYYLHPECVYSVGLSKSSFRTKVSVGSNPWARMPNMVNLAHICERYGGGGHARVGAISFEPGQTERARTAAREIVDELRTSFRGAAK